MRNPGVLRAFEFAEKWSDSEEGCQKSRAWLLLIEPALTERIVKTVGSTINWFFYSLCPFRRCDTLTWTSMSLRKG